MQPLRNNLSNHLQHGSTYKISTLAQKYHMSEHAMKIQLNRLKEEREEITVTDDEVYILFNETHWVWPIVL